MDKPEQKPEIEEPKIKLEMMSPVGTQAIYADNFAIATHDNMVYLYFFQVDPASAFGNCDEKEIRMSAHCQSKVMMTKESFTRLAKKAVEHAEK